MNRRHFLVQAGALLGACLLPGALLRRAADQLAATGQPLIDAPAQSRWALFASEIDTHRWLCQRPLRFDPLSPA